MREQEFIQLWDEEGHSNSINSFFLGSQIDPAQKEHIKQLALKKLADGKYLNENLQTITPKLNHYKRRMSNVRAWLKNLWWRWHWKLAVPLAAILFLSIVGSQLLPQFIQRSSNDVAESGVSKQKQFATMDQQSSVAGAPPMMSKEVAPLATPEAASENSMSFNTRQASDSMTGDVYGFPSPIPPIPMVPPADPNFSKKISHNLNAALQVSNITDTINKLNQDFQQMGGYVVNAQQNGRESGEYGYITAKIPAAKFESFRISLSKIGKILSQSQTANDITNQYYDAQTRLKNWEEEQLRYIEILNEAKSVDDILKVEGALANIRQQIEQLKGQLKLWNNEVEYSTIQLELQSTITPDLKVSDPWQPVSWLKTWTATKDATLKTISSTWNTLNYGLVGIGYAFPYLILLAIIFAGYRLIRKRKK